MIFLEEYMTERKEITKILSLSLDFLWDYNYYVMPEEVYGQVKTELPYGVGVYVPDRLHHGKDWYDLKSVKKAKRKDREKSLTEMLFMMFRSAARDRKES